MTGTFCSAFFEPSGSRRLALDEATAQVLLEYTATRIPRQRIGSSSFLDQAIVGRSKGSRQHLTSHQRFFSPSTSSHQPVYHLPLPSSISTSTSIAAHNHQRLSHPSFHHPYSSPKSLTMPCYHRRAHPKYLTQLSPTVITTENPTTNHHHRGHHHLTLRPSLRSHLKGLSVSCRVFLRKGVSHDGYRGRGGRSHDGRCGRGAFPRWLAGMLWYSHDGWGCVDGRMTGIWASRKSRGV